MRLMAESGRKPQNVRFRPVGHLKRRIDRRWSIGLSPGVGRVIWKTFSSARTFCRARPLRTISRQVYRKSRRYAIEYFNLVHWTTKRHPAKYFCCNRWSAKTCWWSTFALREGVKFFFGNKIIQNFKSSYLMMNG